jgi:hypothetical protein
MRTLRTQSGHAQRGNWYLSNNVGNSTRDPGAGAAFSGAA